MLDNFEIYVHDHIALITTYAFIVLCRTIAVHFTDPFHICTRVADKYNGNGLLLQVHWKYILKT